MVLHLWGLLIRVGASVFLVCVTQKKKDRGGRDETAEVFLVSQLRKVEFCRSP